MAQQTTSFANRAKLEKKAKDAISKKKDKTEVKDKKFTSGNVGVSSGKGNTPTNKKEILPAGATDAELDESARIKSSSVKPPAESRINKRDSATGAGIVPDAPKFPSEKGMGRPSPEKEKAVNAIKKAKSLTQSPERSQASPTTESVPEIKKKTPIRDFLKKKGKEFFTKEGLGSIARGFSTGFEAGLKIPGDTGGLGVGSAIGIGLSKGITSEQDHKASVAKAKLDERKVAATEQTSKLKKAKDEEISGFRGVQNFFQVPKGTPGAISNAQLIKEKVLTEQQAVGLGGSEGFSIGQKQERQRLQRDKFEDFQIARDAEVARDIQELKDRREDRDKDRALREKQATESGNIAKFRANLARQRRDDALAESQVRKIHSSITLRERELIRNPDGPGSNDLKKEVAVLKNDISKLVPSADVWYLDTGRGFLKQDELVPIQGISDLPKGWQKNKSLTPEEIKMIMQFQPVQTDTELILPPEEVWSQVKRVYRKIVSPINRK